MPLVKGKIIPDTWHTPSFVNGWASYGAGYNPAGYLIDANGFVHLRGILTGGAAGSNVFTLPAGYRPQYVEELTCFGYGANGHAIAAFQVAPTGVCTHVVGPSTYLYIDGLLFKAYG
jgi:hypothetical protein